MALDDSDTWKCDRFWVMVMYRWKYARTDNAGC